jgi:hypothetical protein
MEDEAKALEKDASRAPEAPHMFQAERWTTLQHSVKGSSKLCSCQVLNRDEHCTLSL